jgi:hypothetical protein
LNLKNLKEDIFSYLGVETFTPSVNIFEYFNVTYYYEIGHYNAVSNLVSPIQLNTRHTSLLRYFNYLIFIYYRYPGKFSSERKMLKNFLMILMDKGGSRHHVYIDNALYLRNNFSTYGLKKGWIGALPHLRLICLLSAIGGYAELLTILKKSLITSCDINFKKKCAKYEMINPVASYQCGVYRFHEYPFKVVGPNSVLNCNLLAYAILIDSMDDKEKWTDLAKISLERMAESSSLRMMAYAEEEDNPITPAYFDLEYSIYQSSKLKDLDIDSIKIFKNRLSFVEIMSLLIKKILFRLNNGYI